MIFKKYRQYGGYHWDMYKEQTDYRETVNFVIDQFPDKGSCLDLGCGDGLYSYFLKRKGLMVTGIDNSDDGISYAKKRTKGKEIDFWVADLEFVDRYMGQHAWDYCLANDIIEHLTDGEVIKRIFEEHITSYMILATDNAENRASLAKYHAHEYTPNEIKEMFKDYEQEMIYINLRDFIIKIEK